MDFLICGSAAAEAWPAMFCDCRCCLEARRRGGKNLRMRTAYQLGETVRVDLGPDSCAQMLRFGLPFERLRHLLVTHSHADHWLPHELYWRRRGFSVVPEENVLTVHGNAKVRRVLEEQVGEDLSVCRLEFHEIHPGEPIPLGDGIQATPIPAAHDRKELCVFYVFQIGEKWLLQCNDTGWFDEPSWEMLQGYKLDAVVMDCTYGSEDHRAGHLGAPAVVAMRDRMAEAGMLNPGHRFVANHFSHNGGWIHEELEAYFGPRGIETGFDGLRITL